MHATAFPATVDVIVAVVTKCREWAVSFNEGVHNEKASVENLVLTAKLHPSERASRSSDYELE